MFSGDCKFEKVKQTEDRVYILQFNSSDRRFFYFFIDDEKDKDTDNCKKVHNLLNGIDEAPATDAAAAPTTTATQWCVFYGI